MLQVKPCGRYLIASTVVLATGLLIPWRLTATPTAIKRVVAELPNLDFTQGIQGWHKTAMGSDTIEHPYYEVGVDKSMVRDGKPSGFVQSRAAADSSKQSSGDGGVLRYDVSNVANYAGKRLRWSGYVKGKELSKHAFLFAAAFGDESDGGYTFTTSAKVLPGGGDWQKLECFFDLPKGAAGMSLGLRIEGKGIAFGNSFSLEAVDKNIPLTNSKTIQAAEPEAPHNLSFSQGLDGWWNDNPTHDADKNYAMKLEEKGGRNGKAAILLENIVANPRSYGTVAQNAQLKAYKGKRLRISAYLKSENVKSGGDLWIVVHDKNPNKGDGANGESTGKWIRGTQGWTKFEHIVDVSSSTKMLSFGISLKGEGKIWVDGFKLEQMGPPQKP